jgi:hypothetical protein
MTLIGLSESRMFGMVVANRTKVCPDCKRELPLTIEHFYTKGSRAGHPRWDAYCRSCRRARNRVLWAAQRSTPEGAARQRERRAKRTRPRTRPPRPPRRTPTTVNGTWQPPGSNSDLVDTGPLLNYLTAAFPGLDHVAYADLLKMDVSLMRRLLNGEHGHITLHVVDRALTHGLGRPDLLTALYPPEAP